MTYQDTSKREEASKYFWPSLRQQNSLFEMKHVVNNVNSRRKSGYLYCVVCDFQMDTKKMWDNHTNGKRHFNNSQNFEYSDEDPLIQNELNEETRPIAGLDHIYEVMRSNQIAVYQCLLCPAGLLSSESLMNHIMGLAHQMAFLKEHVKGKFSSLRSSKLTESEMEPVIQKIISKYERKHGRGKMFVVKAKEGPEYFFSAYKRHCDYEIDKWFLSNSASYFSSKDFFGYSPTKSARVEEMESESEWKTNLPVREESRDRRYVAKPYHSDAEIPKSLEPKSPLNKIAPEVQDTILERDSFHNPALPLRYEGGRWKDLRLYLEQKKNIETTRNVAELNKEVSVPSSSEIKKDSDALLRLVDDISPEIFLRLALLKLDKLKVKEGKELQLLERIAKKASAVSLKAKKKILAKSLKEKFKETLHPNSTSIQEQSMMNSSSHSNLQFAQNLDNFIGHYKAGKAFFSEDEDLSHSCDLKSSVRKKPMYKQYFNDVSADRNIPELEVVFDSGLNH